MEITTKGNNLYLSKDTKMSWKQIVGDWIAKYWCATDFDNVYMRVNTKKRDIKRACETPVLKRGRTKIKDFKQEYKRCVVDLKTYIGRRKKWWSEEEARKTKKFKHRY